MQLTPATPTDFAALREVRSAHDAGYKAKQLARRRAHYAFLFQRYQDMLTLDDEGCEVSITLKSATKTVTLTASEATACFDLNEMYSRLGSHLTALQAEILGLLAEENDETGTFAGTDEPIMHQVVALCMPQAPSLNADETTAPHKLVATQAA